MSNQKIWGKLKARKWFWMGLTIYVVSIIIVTFTVYNKTGYSAQTNAYFKMIYGTIQWTPEDNENIVINDTIVSNVVLKLKSDDGPITNDRTIKPYELKFVNGIRIPTGYDNISKLNFTFRIYTPEKIDYSETVIWFNFTDINEQYNKLTIDLTNNNQDFSFNYSWDGQLTVDTSGMKQMFCQSYITLVNSSGQKSFDTVSEEDSFNLIEIEPIDKYQNYLYTKVSVTGIVASALIFSLPATYKVIRDLYKDK